MSEIVAYDRIGQEIKVGSIIAVPYTKSKLAIGRVTSITPKKVRFEDIHRIHGSSQEARPTYNKYQSEVICLDNLDETVMFIMTQNL